MPPCDTANYHQGSNPNATATLPRMHLGKQCPAGSHRNLHWGQMLRNLAMPRWGTRFASLVPQGALLAHKGASSSNLCEAGVAFRSSAVAIQGVSSSFFTYYY